MRYIAFHLPSLELLNNDVQLREVSLYRGKNEISELTGELDRASAYQDTRRESTGELVPLLRNTGTLLVAYNGYRARGYIVRSVEPSEDNHDRVMISALGFVDLLRDRPYFGSRQVYIRVDPLRIIRDIFAYITEHENSLPISVDDTTSPTRVGEEEETNEGFTRSDGSEAAAFDHGPRKLVWHSTENLLKEFEDYILEAPAEWREDTILDFSEDLPRPSFRLRLGYPTLGGQRRENLKFQVGSNVIDPDFHEDTEYFSEVVVLGNGEGQARKRGRGYRAVQDRLHAPKRVEDSSATTNEQCRRIAQELCDKADVDSRFIESCTVRPHPAAMPYQYDVGDTINIKGEFTWGKVDQWCRIVSMEHTPADDHVRLELEPLED